MKSRDSFRNERVPVFFKKSFKLCIHSIKNIDAKLYLLKINKTMEAMYKKDVTVRLQDEMAGAWAGFAKTGSPNEEKLPTWEPYTEEKKACMIYGDKTVLKENQRRRIK